MLEVKNLDTGYDFLLVLWDVNLHVAEGEFVALVGPNGAGKTTTLRAIAGLLPPTKGQILFRQKSIGGLPAHQITRMGISFVSETLNLFPAMTVLEELDSVMSKYDSVHFWVPPSCELGVDELAREVLEAVKAHEDDPSPSVEVSGFVL